MTGQAMCTEYLRDILNGRLYDRIKIIQAFIIQAQVQDVVD
jgi:hypothetical protein